MVSAAYSIYIVTAVFLHCGGYIILCTYYCNNNMINDCFDYDWNLKMDKENFKFYLHITSIHTTLHLSVYLVKISEQLLCHGIPIKYPKNIAREWGII